MKSNKYLRPVLSVWFLLFVICNLSNAQEIRIDTIKTNKTRTIRIATLKSVPKFILQLSGSWNSGAMELSEHNGGFNSSDFKLGKSFGARNGYGITLMGKLPLHKKGHFWIDALASYNRFQSDLIASSPGEGRISYNVFSWGAGMDYNFTPADRVKYFLGGSTLFSLISGSGDLLGTDTTTKYHVNIKSSFRIGYTVFAGLEYALDKSFGLNVGVKFSHINLLLKKSTVPADSSETVLNDASSTSFYSGWKQFAYASVFGGISYYFGVKERRYKLP